MLLHLLSILTTEILLLPTNPWQFIQTSTCGIQTLRTALKQLPGVLKIENKQFCLTDTPGEKDSYGIQMLNYSPNTLKRSLDVKNFGQTSAINLLTLYVSMIPEFDNKNIYLVYDDQIDKEEIDYYQMAFVRSGMNFKSFMPKSLLVLSRHIQIDLKGNNTSDDMGKDNVNKDNAKKDNANNDNVNNDNAKKDNVKKDNVKKDNNNTYFVIYFHDHKITFSLYSVDEKIKRIYSASYAFGNKNIETLIVDEIQEKVRNVFKDKKVKFINACIKTKTIKENICMNKNNVDGNFFSTADDQDTLYCFIDKTYKNILQRLSHGIPEYKELVITLYDSNGNKKFQSNDEVVFSLTSIKAKIREEIQKIFYGQEIRKIYKEIYAKMDRGEIKALFCSETNFKDLYKSIFDSQNESSNNVFTNEYNNFKIHKYYSEKEILWGFPLVKETVDCGVIENNSRRQRDKDVDVLKRKVEIYKKFEHFLELNIFNNDDLKEVKGIKVHDKKDDLKTETDVNNIQKQTFFFNYADPIEIQKLNSIFDELKYLVNTDSDYSEKAEQFLTLHEKLVRDEKIRAKEILRRMDGVEMLQKSIYELRGELKKKKYHKYLRSLKDNNFIKERKVDLQDTKPLKDIKVDKPLKDIKVDLNDTKPSKDSKDVLKMTKLSKESKDDFEEKSPEEKETGDVNDEVRRLNSMVASFRREIETNEKWFEENRDNQKIGFSDFFNRHVELKSSFQMLENEIKRVEVLKKAKNIKMGVKKDKENKENRKQGVDNKDNQRESNDNKPDGENNERSQEPNNDQPKKENNVNESERENSNGQAKNNTDENKNTNDSGSKNTRDGVRKTSYDDKKKTHDDDKKKNDDDEKKTHDDENKNDDDDENKNDDDEKKNDDDLLSINSDDDEPGLDIEDKMGLREVFRNILSKKGRGKSSKDKEFLRSEVGDKLKEILEGELGGLEKSKFKNEAVDASTKKKEERIRKENAIQKEQDLKRREKNRLDEELRHQEKKIERAENIRKEAETKNKKKEPNWYQSKDIFKNIYNQFKRNGDGKNDDSERKEL